LEFLYLSNNQIKGFLYKPESIEILKKFLETQKNLRILDLSENDHQITKKGLDGLFKAIMLLSDTRLKRLKRLDLTNEKWWSSIATQTRSFQKGKSMKEKKEEFIFNFTKKEKNKVLSEKFNKRVKL